MKHTLNILVIVLLAGLMLPACRKNEEPSPYWGTASAWFNGENWNELRGWKLQVSGATGAPADLPPCQPGILHIVMEKSTSEGIRREVLSITKIPPAVGTYPVHIFKNCQENKLVGSGYSLVGADGDVLLDSYRVLETEDNWVEVTDYNANTGEIRGNFQIAFVHGGAYDVVKREKVVTSFPDTVRFTNGQFHTRVITNSRQ